MLLFVIAMSQSTNDNNLKGGTGSKKRFITKNE